ncbi:MAG: family 20 glycosylhydrolase [Chitinispirillia bacterium]|nr:family 20 glycosylhydrolase [Chitinispirillia bacterium]MCL2268459.1 family 20 glycosylhydrolase [Chitinispirillia bacterium]
MKEYTADMLKMIPMPKELTVRPGVMKVTENIPIDFVTAGDDLPGSPERYTLTVTPHGVKILSPSKEGLYRAGTTLRQLMKNCHGEVPCLEINDWPDFPVRGFYHDVTRGRVPKLETLKRLADTLAFYKINHLQLYVEHTFAFTGVKGLRQLWKGKDPLTADDIREFDNYCAERYIDLVPSLSTFGHMYELLRLPRFERLNELDVRASKTKRCLWDRMAHYTLDAGNPESFDLVRGMVEEYAPLFRSGYFNICCDETFDLGKGKNAAWAKRAGVGRLYVDFVRKIMDVVRSLNKKPMLWGDIVLKHPDLISELAGDDTVFLNWEYTPEVTNESVQTFKNAGVKQYVCPGVNGWSRFAPDVNRACKNIYRMIRFGKDAGAAGVLNTDWGDCGQVNLLSSSYHGLAFGADLSWNAGDGGSADGDAVCINGIDDNFDERFAFLQWGGGDITDRLGKILREAGELSADYHFGNLYAWVNGKQCLWYKEEEVKSADPKDLLRRYSRAAELERELSSWGEDYREYIWGARATAWLLALLIVKKKYEYNQEIDEADIPVSPRRLIKDRDGIRGGSAILKQFKELWLERNRESEMGDVVETFEKILRRIKKWC